MLEVSSLHVIKFIDYNGWIKTRNSICWKPLWSEINILILCYWHPQRIHRLLILQFWTSQVHPNQMTLLTYQSIHSPVLFIVMPTLFTLHFLTPSSSMITRMEKDGKYSVYGAWNINTSSEIVVELKWIGSWHVGKFGNTPSLIL